MVPTSVIYDTFQNYDSIDVIKFSDEFPAVNSTNTVKTSKIDFFKEIAKQLGIANDGDQFQDMFKKFAEELKGINIDKILKSGTVIYGLLRTVSTSVYFNTVHIK